MSSVRSRTHVLERVGLGPAFRAQDFARGFRSRWVHRRSPRVAFNRQLRTRHHPALNNKRIYLRDCSEIIGHNHAKRIWSDPVSLGEMRVLRRLGNNTSCPVNSTILRLTASSINEVPIVKRDSGSRSIDRERARPTLNELEVVKKKSERPDLQLFRGSGRQHRATWGFSYRCRGACLCSGCRSPCP
jgi:hypothetical protein